MAFCRFISGAPEGLVGIFAVDDGVAAQHHPLARRIVIDRPRLKTVVVVFVHIVTILDDVVFKNQVVAQAAQVARAVVSAEQNQFIGLSSCYAVVPFGP